MTLDDAHEQVDQAVMYAPVGADPETGVITRVSHRFVFVRFDGEHRASPPARRT